MASTENSRSTNSSAVSQTSTARYGHETWVDFAPRVHQLCRLLWPSEFGDFKVEKLKGGSFNRIIGVETPSSERFILRIPRFQFAQQKREMAILRYVRQHTSIPTAQTVFFDSTEKNPLEEPYVVHTRIPGQDLHVFYRTLSHEHKLATAEQWGQLLLSQLAVRNDFAGIVDSINDDTYGFRPIEVHPESDIEDVRLLSKQSILDFFVLQFNRWNDADRRAYPDDPPLDLLDQLIVVAKEMDAAGLFGDNVFFSLCHLDLAPRNVMADINETSNSLQITGVLDWDSAVFGPNFMLCEPPSWIWAWSDDDDESESDNFMEIHANDVPATAQDQELKLRFEQAVGVDLLKFFYMPQYRLARSLFNLAIKGLRSTHSFDTTKRLIKEWDKLQGKPELADSEEDLGDEPYHSDQSGSYQSDEEPYHSDQDGDEPDDVSTY